MNMRFVHSVCGGEIETSKRVCTKCGKKWNKVGFMFSSSIRPMTDSKGKVVVSKATKPSATSKKYASWADKLPLVPTVASKLPNWPRWARIATVTVISSVIIIIILYFISGRI